MANTILMKSRQSNATEPGATALKVGELAVNTFDGRVYLGTDIGGSASRSAGGAATASTPVGAPILDENDMSSDSDKSLATQQSIKKYVDDEITANAGTGDITGVTLAGDSGSAADTSANVDLTIAGGSGITTSATGTTVTIAGDNASTSAKGVAQFSSDNFAASSGTITIKDGGVANAELAGSIADSKLSQITTAGKVALSALEIDGATDIGAGLADADLFIVDDGGGGTNRKCAASRLKTYLGIGAGASDIANLDIDGGTDIGANLADADLLIVDDGAGGTNRKFAASRIKTYVADITLTTAAQTAITSVGTLASLDISGALDVDGATTLDGLTVAEASTFTGEITANGGVAGNVTGNVSGSSGSCTGTSAIATSVTATANNSTDETVYLTFVDGATGTQGVETDTGLSYNPSSGTITTTAIGAHSVTGALTTQAITPDGNGTRDLGASGTRWANVYSSDLDLSNEAKGANSIDNTWGSYLIEEGENDLFLKNRRTGKQYKFCLQEV